MITRRMFASNGSMALGGLVAGGCLSPFDGERPPDWTEGRFQAHFIYTGGGESVFFVYPDGTSLLIDCGDVEPDAPTAWTFPQLPRGIGHPAARVADYVRRVNPNGRKVDSLLLTHYHADHGGHALKSTPASADGSYRKCGLGEAVDLLDFGKAVDRSYPDFDDPVAVDMEWDDFMAANCRGVYRELERRGKRVEKFSLRPDSDQLNPLHGGSGGFAVRPVAANGRILMPDGTVRGLYADFAKRTHPKPLNENAMSIALLFRYGRFSLYTGGDLEAVYKDETGTRVSLEEELAKALEPVSVAKLNHHGIDCPRALAETLRPQVWVCTQWSHCHLTDAVMQTISDPRIPPANRLVLPQYRKPEAPVPRHIVVDVAPGGASYDVCTVAAATGQVLDKVHFNL